MNTNNPNAVPQDNLTQRKIKASVAREVSACTNTHEPDFNLGVFTRENLRQILLDCVTNIRANAAAKQNMADETKAGSAFKAISKEYRVLQTPRLMHLLGIEDAAVSMRDPERLELMLSFMGEGEDELLICVKMGMVKAVRKALAGRPDVNIRDIHGRSAMHSAVHLNDTRMMACLIEAGCEIDARDRQGYTPLLYALSGNSSKAAQMLLGRGANIHHKADNGMGAQECANEGGTAVQALVKPILDKAALVAAVGNMGCDVKKSRKM